jgi:hypothetical protein
LWQEFRSSCHERSQRTQGNRSGFSAATLALLLGSSVFLFSSALARAAAGDSAELAAAIAAPGSSQTAVTSLINRLTERGLLTKQDSAELLLLAEADAAEARAQAAITQAALAQAAAAQARARAYAAMAHLPVSGTAQRGSQMPSGEDMGGTPMPRGTGVPPVDSSERATSDLQPRVAHRAPPPQPVAAQEALAAEQTDEIGALGIARSTNSAENAPSPDVGRVLPNSPRGSSGEVGRPRPTDSSAAAAEESVPDDTVRVTYVPEVVKEQLREEVKQDVLDEARKEGWATPRAVPSWVSKFRLFGDLRTRYEGFRYPVGNDNTGGFANFNAINTGAPWDVSSVSNLLFSPQINVDQNRKRVRLRTRVGAEVDMGEGFSAGVRVATGENNSPVTENQSFGLAGSGQGGNFSKYSIWLDRGFMKYELGGMPDKDLTFSIGRFDNPFFTTTMVWADDLGFDGLAIQGKFPIGEDVTPFFTVGAFPVFNTDLNFASNQPAKFKSNDKWLYGSQLGSTFDLGRNFGLKLGAAYYLFQNIEGKLSTPFTPLNSVDAGDTDTSRPAFAQKGNTYMALRDILPKAEDAVHGGNLDGTINQFQYFGLASKFHELALDARLDFNQFEPFQISLQGEYVKNRAFDEQGIAAIAVNNLGAPTSTTSTKSAPFLGGGTAWLVRLTMGDAALQKAWDWNVNLGYRKVESDAVVDGFCDSDFGGGGTNLKGLTIGTNLALSRAVWLNLRWFSATQVSGPTFKNDIIQFDLNGKF